MLGWLTAIGLSLAGLTLAAGCQRTVWLARLLGGLFAAGGLLVALPKIVPPWHGSAPLASRAPELAGSQLPLILINKPWSLPGGVLLLEVRPNTPVRLCGLLLLVLLATQLFPGRTSGPNGKPRWNWWGACVLAGLTILSSGFLLRLSAWIGLLLVILLSDPESPTTIRKRSGLVVTLALAFIVGGAVVLSGTGDVLAWDRSGVGSEWGLVSLVAGVGLVIMELLGRAWTTTGWQRQTHVWRLWLWFVVSAAALDPQVQAGDKNVWSSLQVLGQGAVVALAGWGLAHRFSVTKEPA